MAAYHLRCRICNRELSDDFIPSCNCDSPSLVNPYFTVKSFSPLHHRSDIWKFRDWLPVRDMPANLPGSKSRRQTAVFSSGDLSRELGLQNLYCAFTGYWPERDTHAASCTFKELEAHPTLQRAREFGLRGLTLASAGNTARAFIQNAFLYDIELVVVVPFHGMKHLWLPGDIDGNALTGIKGSATIVSVDGDYFDAISIAGKLRFLEEYSPEGGARNIARRCGMGTVLLEHVAVTGSIPRHYFQAVGSGTGAIAAHEAAKRLLQSEVISDNRVTPPKLHLAQNIPFTPMVDAWNAKRRDTDDLTGLATSTTRDTTTNLYASMLANRSPPYSIAGGVFDCLTESNGEMYAIETDAAKEAGKLFTSIEGIDLAPEAEVTLAALISAAESGKVSPGDNICLNLTGGGTVRLQKDLGTEIMEPDIIISDPDISDEELEALFR